MSFVKFYKLSEGDGSNPMIFAERGGAVAEMKRLPEEYDPVIETIMLPMNKSGMLAMFQMGADTEGGIACYRFNEGAGVVPLVVKEEDYYGVFGETDDE
jgi:hypothetical protein